MRKIIVILFLLFLSLFLIFPNEGGNKIIILYKSSDGQSVDNNNATWYLLPILKNWGFELEYYDTDIKLPDPGSLNNVYAVISWLSSGSTEKPLELITWYENIIDNNIRLVLMGNLGFWSDKKTKRYLSEEEINRVMLKLGIEYKGEWTNQKNNLNVIYTDKEMYANNFEVTDEINYFLFKPSTLDICRHLIIERNDLNDSGSTLVFSSPTGGLAFYSFMFQGKTNLLNFNNFLSSSLFTNNRGQNILIAGNNIQNINNIKEIYNETEYITKETNMDNFLTFCPERLKMYNLIIIEATDYQEISEDFINKLNDYTSSGGGIILIGNKKNLPGLKGKVIVWSNDKSLSNKSNPLFLQVTQAIIKKDTLWGLKDKKTIELYLTMINNKDFTNNEELEKEITALRFELGKYYLLTHKYNKAEVEFKKVLEIDKDNLDVKLKLAEAYQLNKKWYLAMKIYKEIYETEPEDTDSASNYNELANEHPKYFSSNTEFWSSGDVPKDEENNTKTYNQKTIYIKEELKLHIFLSQYIFLDFFLDIQNRTHKLDFAKFAIETYNEDLTEVASGFPNTLRYNDITFKTRLGVEIPNTGLLFYGTIGFDSFFAFQVQTDDIDHNPDRSLRDKIFSGTDDFIDQLAFYPYFDAGIAWDFIPYFNFEITYTHQLKKDSVIPWIDGFYFSKDAYLGTDPAFRTFISENDILFNINYNFGFIKVYPLTNIYFSNSFEFIFYTLSDPKQAIRSNCIPYVYSLTQGIDYKVFELTNIGLTHHLLFKLNYEGSQKDFEDVSNISEINENFDINENDIFAKMYSPHQNFKVLGGFRFIYNFQTLTEAPMAASVTCYAGAVWKDLFNKPEIIDEDDEHADRNYDMPYILVVINHSIEFWLKRLYLGFQFEYSLAYDLCLDDETWQSFYGSLFIKVPFHNNLTYSKY